MSSYWHKIDFVDETVPQGSYRSWQTWRVMEFLNSFPGPTILIVTEYKGMAAVFSLNFSPAGKGPAMASKGKNMHPWWVEGVVE